MQQTIIFGRQDFCKYYGISKHTFYELIRDDLPCHLIGKTKQLMFHVAEVEAWAREKCRKGLKSK